MKLKHEPYNKFKGKLRELGLTYADIAKTLSISETAVSHKVNGRSDFNLTEVDKIGIEYGISRDIFLN